MRGRLPTPTVLRELRGNPARRPLNDDEPEITPAEVSVQPPDHLDEEARKEWERLIPILTASRLLTTGDLVIFALYCYYWSEWKRQCIEMETNVVRGPYRITKGNKKADGSDGDPYTFWNPARTVRDAAADKAARYAAELGLTPSSRTRVKKDGPQGQGQKTAAQIMTTLRLV